MKNKLLILAMAAVIATVAGCAKSQTPDTKTAMQKRYKSQSECQKDFPVVGDCTRQTTTGGGGGFFMSPFFYPWGGIMHSNGSMSYNNRVPSSGYTAAPAHVQNRMASRTNFNKVPAKYTSARSGSSTRGGFGGSARSSSARSYGG